MSVMLYPCMLCCSVNGSVCFVCCVFVNCLVKQFAMCLSVVAILLLNVFSVEVLCWIDRVWSSKECGACCACDSRVHLSVPSIGFVYVFVCRKLSPHLGV